MSRVWSDLRPISIVNFADNRVTPTNPNGFFGAQTVDVTSGAGLLELQRMMRETTASTIDVAKGINSQGAMVWSMEGCQFPDAWYVGDPEAAWRLAPEMMFGAPVGMLDEMFAMFAAAGLRTGCTLRHTESVVGLDGKWKQVQPEIVGSTPARTLARKAEYARKRFGCSMFYVDSTVRDGNVAMTAAELGIKNDARLFCPENTSDAESYKVCVPYRDMRNPGQRGPDAAALAANPLAMHLLNVRDQTAGNEAVIVDMIKRKQIIPCCDAWWWTEDAKFLKSLVGK